MKKKAASRKANSGNISAEKSRAASASAPFSWVPDWFWAALLALAIGLVYLPTLWAGFVWDDNILISSNPGMVGFSGLKQIWTTTAADVCPFVLTTFWLEHAVWGPAPLPYHLVNIAFHIAGALLLWQVLRKLQVPGAWLGAALWALHPVQVESVAWVSEMKNTESGVFFLLSIYFFVKWLKPRDVDGQTRDRWSYVLTLLFAALALASKSSTAILPVVLCLCAWWIEGRWRWRHLGSTLPIFVMSIVAACVSIWTQFVLLVTAIDPQLAPGWPARLIGAGYAIWFYLGKLLFPHPLSIVYPRWDIAPDQWTSYLPLLAAVVTLIILWWYRGTWSRPYFFAYAYFLVALLPILGLADNYIFRYAPVFDHFQYLAGMGPLALAGAALAWISEKALARQPAISSAVCAGLLLTVGTISWLRTSVYQNEVALWTDTLSKNPNCWVARNNLGLALLQNEQTDEAIYQFQQALELEPNYAQAHFNLGAPLLKRGQLDDAIAQFQAAANINSYYEDAYRGLGNAFLQKGQIDDAIRNFQKALAINPNDTEAESNLGNALYQTNKLDDAMTHYEKALATNPNLPEALSNMGSIYLKKGQIDEALLHYQKALQLSPNSADVHYNLANAYVRQGLFDDAIAELQEVLQLNPGDTAAQKKLKSAQDLASKHESLTP